MTEGAREREELFEYLAGGSRVHIALIIRREGLREGSGETKCEQVVVRTMISKWW
jgi:hypothetical protein